MNYPKALTRNTLYSQTKFPKEKKVNQRQQTQGISFLGKTYQKMYDKKNTLANSVFKKENVPEAKDKYIIVNSQRNHVP